MTSRTRRVEPGHVYHVFNRGTNRRRLFFRDTEYAAFESLVATTFERTALTIYTYELMPNHWHFVVRPVDQKQLSEFFQYLAGTHGKRFRVTHRTVGEGHVYQDRFKSFPVECDEHFLVLARYVERNALRSGLVSRAEDWRWGGLWRRLHGGAEWLEPNWPVPRTDDWVERVNQRLTTAETAAIHTSIRRGCPFGTPQWERDTADELGLLHSLRRPGRPRASGRRSRDRVRPVRPTVPSETGRRLARRAGR